MMVRLGFQPCLRRVAKARALADGRSFLEPDDIKSASAQGKEAVEIEAFVDADAVPPQYFEKPYVLVPGKKAEKGYVLLREVLTKTGKVGIGRVVIRTKEYLAMVTPQDDALMMILLRFPQEIVDIAEYNIPEGGEIAKAGRAAGYQA